MQRFNNIDSGRSFDWGRTSADYAKYRDIYPDEFYQHILRAGLCRDGQRVLDIGTGTGVLPRNMYKYGAKWVGTDISAEQIAQAQRLSAETGMDIDFYVCPAEELSFPDDSFDAATACQCIWYPDHGKLAPRLARMLRQGGKFLILYMAWLPFEDEIAGRSEELVLKYNPVWSGAGEVRKQISVPEEYLEYFDITNRELYDLRVPFTRESWHGRMRACRGVGASLSPQDLSLWDEEHRRMLRDTAPESFEVLHFAASAELTLKRRND